MIIQILTKRQINLHKLIDCRNLSYYYMKRPSLSTSFYNKNNTLHPQNVPHKCASSMSSITLPSWFMALSNSTPVAYAQQFVISCHEITGTPWWASIILSAVVLRLAVTLPLTAYQVGKIIFSNFLYYT